MKLSDIKIPDVGVTDLVRCFTRGGRQALVRRVVYPFVRIDTISSLITEGAAQALDAGTGRISDERCAQISEGCAAVEQCCSIIRKSINPDGDGGKRVTDNEKVMMENAITTGVRSLLTQDAIDETVEKLITKVP